MGKTATDRFIISSPHKEPKRHWRWDRETRPFALVKGRRPEGFVVALHGSMSFDDPSLLVEIPLVNHRRLRGKVGEKQFVCA